MQKILVDKLIAECTETIEEVKLAKITLPKMKMKINIVLAQCIVY